MITGRWPRRKQPGESEVGVEVAEDVGFLKAVGEHEGFVGEDLKGGAVGDEAASVQKKSARAKLGDELEVVGGDDPGGGDLGEKSHELAFAAGVEAAGGFVEEKDGGVAGEKAGQTHAAFFTAAEMMWKAAVEIGQADLGECGADARGDVGPGEGELLGAEGNVFEDGGAEELVVGVLKEQAHLAADGVEIGLDDGLAEDVDGTVVAESLREEAVEVKKKSGFAGAVGADEGDTLGGRDAEGDGGEGLPAVGVAEGEVVHVDGVHLQPRAHMAR
jgi:hypothetical protein